MSCHFLAPRKYRFYCVKMTLRNVFVTVGTTKFDELIETVTQEDILHTFVDLGYHSLTLQIGNGSFEPKESDIINIKWYRFKSSIGEDIHNANLVISHAGAGSCMEILKQKKILIAVVNENLMGNHQKELARLLAKRNYLIYSTCGTLQQNLLDEKRNLIPYPEGNPKRFVEYLNKSLGIDD